jgi:hypothetical protein
MEYHLQGEYLVNDTVYVALFIIGGYDHQVFIHMGVILLCFCANLRQLFKNWQCRDRNVKGGNAKNWEIDACDFFEKKGAVMLVS